MRLKLTTANVKAAKAKGGKRLTLRDTVTTGLILRVSPKGERTEGAKVWCLEYRVHGLRRLMVMKHSDDGGAMTFPEVPLVDARKEATRLKGIVSQSDDPLDERKARKAVATVAELATMYIEDYAKDAKRSWKKDDAILKREVLPVIGHLKPDEVSKDHLKRIWMPKKKAGHHIQANRIFEIVRGLFNFAISETDALKVNPCAGMKRPTKVEPSRARILDDDEIKIFWNNLETAAMSWGTKQALRLALLTAQRIGEVVGIAKDELDLDAAVWDLPAYRAKNGREHRIELSPLVVNQFREAIKRSPEKSAYLFPGAHRHQKADAPITAGAVSTAVNRNQEHFGLAHWTAHDLRRTASSNFGALHFNRLINDKILNHLTADKGISGVYDRYDYGREKRQCMEAWALRLQEITSGNREGGRVVPFAPTG